MPLATRASLAPQQDHGVGMQRRRTSSSTNSVTTYRGRALTAEIRGLEPNTLYKFTLRCISPRSHSRLSQPVEVWTAPTPPTAPCVVRTEPKAVVVKWYTGPGGGEKYVLESRLINTLDDLEPRRMDYFIVSDRLTKSVREKTTRKYGTVTSASEWKVAYEGRETTIRVGYLQPRAAYRFRVRALNGCGHGSNPSQLMQATTALVDTPALIPRRAAEQFCVDTHGDVVVGDTILFTERLLVGGKAQLLGEPSRGSSKLNREGSLSGDRKQKDAVGPKHIGDRTIAAHVIAESFYAVAHSKKDMRELRVEIVWCTVSNHEAAPYLLRPGDVVQRDAAHVLQFEVFRCTWTEEHKRKSHQQERTVLHQL